MLLLSFFIAADFGGDSNSLLNRDHLARLYLLDISQILIALFFVHLYKCLFLVLNNTSSVLLVLLWDNLFALIQSTLHFKFLLMYLLICFSDLSVSSKLVSSAK